MDKAPKPPPPAAVDPLINLTAATGVNPYGPLNSGQIQKQNYHKQIGNPMFMAQESPEAKAIRGRRFMAPEGVAPELQEYANGGPVPEAFKKFETLQRQNRIYDDKVELYREVAKKRMQQELLKGGEQPVNYKAKYPYGRNRVSDEG